MKKINKTMGLFAFLFIMMVGIAYAAVTCDFDQTSNAYLKGASNNLSVTIDLSAQGGESENVSACVISVAGGTITGATTFNLTGTSNNNTYCNTTIATGALLDDTTYTYTMTMYNATGASLGTCTETYKVDNSIPVLSSPSPADSIRYDSGNYLEFSITCTNSSAATFYYDGIARTMTESSDNCTYTLPYAADGGHKWYIVGTDGLNTTTGSTYSFEVSTPGGFVSITNPDGTYDGVTTTGAGDDRTALIVGALVVYWIVYGNKAKGKSSRRRKK